MLRLQGSFALSSVRPEEIAVFLAACTMLLYRDRSNVYVLVSNLCQCNIIFCLMPTRAIYSTNFWKIILGVNYYNDFIYTLMAIYMSFQISY